MPTNHGGLVTPNDDTSVDFTEIFQTFAESAEPGVVGYYANTTDRDAGTLALRTAGKKGFVCFVAAPPAGISPSADWCGWNGSEWIWAHPTPATYNSGLISGTDVNYNTFQGHNPSAYTFTPARSGFARIGLWISAQIGAVGIGTGDVRPRYASGVLLPAGPQFTAINENPVGYRFDSEQWTQSPIWLQKDVAVSLAFDLRSFFPNGYWKLLAAQWKITQV